MSTTPFNHTRDHSRITGLTHDEVAERVDSGQVNRVEKFTTRTVSGILRNNILTLFNGILAASVTVLLVINAYSDAVFLSAVTCANMLVGIIGEFRAKWALDRLALLQRRIVTVVRDGHVQEIAIDEVVKDDLVVLGPGDQIIADGVLVSLTPVFIDEALLTGEADTVKKLTGDPISSGSYCVRGSGQYIATHIGRESNVNRLTEQAKAYKTMLTPSQKNINTIIQALTAIMILFVVLLLMAGYIKHLSLAASILSIVTVIKALVPEGLVLVSTLAFTLGALRAARKQVLVQKLNAVESLSHLTTLCLDKTGTLGTNRLQFECLIPLGPPYQEVAHRLGLFVGAETTRNQTILAIAAEFPAIAGEVVEELPFGSEHKMSAVRVRRVDSEEVSLWLGAPETLANGRLTPQQEQMLSGLRQKGLRVLAFASCSQPIPQRDDLSILGFIVLRDELRPDVTGAIKFYEARGVTLKVLSGDHPETVLSLARQAGISVRGAMAGGNDLARMAPDDFSKAVREGQFFGRLLPLQKQQIIKCLQDSGEFVGMVGDGINDILALKQADIGIAMNAGAAVARDVSDIILLKDTFAHLPALSQEGDRIIYNIKRVSRLFLTKNVYSLFFILFVGFVGLEFPLSPRSITWIDLLTIGTPAAVLTLMAPSLEKQSLAHFLRETLKFSMLAGITIAFFSLFVYANFFLFQDRTESYGRTAGVSVIVLMGLYVLFHATTAERRADSAAVERWGVRVLLIGAFLFHLVAVYWPPLRDLLGMVSLDADSWLTIIGASAAGMWSFHQLLKGRFLIKAILPSFILAAVLAGCTTFHPRPLSPAQTASAFEARTMDNQGLKEFVEKNLHHKITPLPPGSWDLEMLTLAAFYYHPDMDVARARWGVARAEVITAGGRPNPGVGFTPQYNADTAGGLSPWTLGFNLDIPLETAGKRGYRIARAEHISEAARLNIAGVAWQVRSRLRRNLLSLYRAEQAEALLQEQQKVQEEMVRLLEQRLSFGEASQPDVTLVHISLAQTLLSLREAQKQRAEAQAQVANALGLPVDALNNVHISFDFLKQLPLAKDIPLQNIRRQALLNRPDILSALEVYAAAQEALQLEIARQYPDIHLGPGYLWDQEANKWSLGFSISLPVFNRNEGPIAGAEARCREAEAVFIALQSRIIGEIDRSFAGYHSALQKLETADSLQSTKGKQLQSIQTMFDAGETDRLSFLSSQSELYSIALLQLDALANAQQFLSLLEDAVQRPLQPLKPFPIVPETNPRTKEAGKNEAE